MGANLYVHFPFCRRKCAYCALLSRPGSTEAERASYACGVAERIRRLGSRIDGLSTVYFGGGTPAFCDLGPVFDALGPHLGADCEFTVELHPLDVARGLLETLRAGGVNRISMGVQSLEDGVLAAMGRGYTAAQASRSFEEVRGVFENSGIDLIAGYPGESCELGERLPDIGSWGLAHCSVYSLQNERGLEGVPDDSVALDRIAETAELLSRIGLKRYEISNYAVPGRECRHNLAVWRGEDYFGIGEGAHGRLGLLRTVDYLGPHSKVETVESAEDATERRIFRLRTRYGLDAEGREDWTPALGRFVSEGLLTREGETYRLTARGTEVCDAILAELV